MEKVKILNVFFNFFNLSRPAFSNPIHRNQEVRLEHGRYTLGRRGSGLKITKQTQKTEILGPSWDALPCRSVEGAGRCHCKTLTHNNLWSITATGRRVWRLEESKCHFYFQKRQEGGLRESESCQPHFNPREGNRGISRCITKNSSGAFSMASVMGSHAWLTW